MMKQNTNRKKNIMKERKKETNRDIKQRKERHKQGWENQEYQPQRKGKRKASKFNTPAEIRPFTSIFFVILSSLSQALSFFYSVFHTNCQFAVLWKKQSRFLLSL